MRETEVGNGGLVAERERGSKRERRYVDEDEVEGGEKRERERK